MRINQRSDLLKSPGGSLYPYYYKGGEIHCLKYGSKHRNFKELYHLMKMEEEFIFQTNKQLRIWVDLYETVITDQVLQELTNNLVNLNDHIKKISFVGLSTISKWRLKKRLNRLNLSRGSFVYNRLDTFNPRCVKCVM